MGCLSWVVFDLYPKLVIAMHYLVTICCYNGPVANELTHWSLGDLTNFYISDFPVILVIDG